MKIEDNILAITNCLFKDKHNWKFVTKKQKETFFFPINRLLSKKYPELAQLINNKNSDCSSGLDCWFSFFLNKPYPSWMWTKRAVTKEEDWTLVMQEYDINHQDLEILKLVALDQLKEENKYLIKQKTI